MSEIDDAISRERDAAQQAARHEAFVGDHGLAWREVTVGSELAGLVADFVPRIPAGAGRAAYWVDRIGEPTVHLSKARTAGDKFWHVVGAVSDNWSSYHQPHAVRQERAERRDSRGPARLFAITNQREYPAEFAFLRRDGGLWRPAASSHRSDWQTRSREELLEAIVAFLERGVTRQL
ncbi:MAG: hypothetical protein M3Y46_05510 [Actinomycetota bacterium]|nr:hypothetical protein [Actinomycetota bacterium]